jgi:hypothetical protein
VAKLLSGIALKVPGYLRMNTPADVYKLKISPFAIFDIEFT